eukprot:Amastigsp_a175606_17.p3 type:complete len:125 gc:universal Amastigsp_a175606_17:632-258(-)
MRQATQRWLRCTRGCESMAARRCSRSPTRSAIVTSSARLGFGSHRFAGGCTHAGTWSMWPPIRCRMLRLRRSPATRCSSEGAASSSRARRQTQRPRSRRWWRRALRPHLCSQGMSTPSPISSLR